MGLSVYVAAKQRLNSTVTATGADTRSKRVCTCHVLSSFRNRAVKSADNEGLCLSTFRYYVILRHSLALYVSAPGTISYMVLNCKRILLLLWEKRLLPRFLFQNFYLLLG